MKKKISAIIVVATLCLIGVVIVHGFEDANEMNQSGQISDKIFKPENGRPPSNKGDKPPMENSTELTGILEIKDQSFYIEDSELFIGPDEIISKQASHFDYDGDEVIETLYREMNGLTGTNVSIRGHINKENRFVVLEMNDLPVVTPQHPPDQMNHKREPMRDHGLRLE